MLQVLRRRAAVAGGRLFLVPEQWQDGVVVLPDDDEVRVQYVP